MGLRGPAHRDPAAADAHPRPALTAALRIAGRLVRWLYTHRLGRLVGGRILLLHHTGRRSGRRYTTPLEVVGRSASGAPVVVAGFGAADWLRNLTAGGPAGITIGAATGPVRPQALTVEDVVAVLAGYEHRHARAAPLVRRLLSALLGWPYRGTEQDRIRAAAQLPMVALEAA